MAEINSINVGNQVYDIADDRPYIKKIIEFTATQAAKDESGKHYPVLWIANVIQDMPLTDGFQVTFKTPTAGHDYGIFLSLNKGYANTFFPIGVDAKSATRLSTEIPAGSIITLQYNTTQKVTDVYPPDGSTNRTNFTGVWKLVNSVIPKTLNVESISGLNNNLHLEESGGDIYMDLNADNGFDFETQDAWMGLSSNSFHVYTSGSQIDINTSGSILLSCDDSSAGITMSPGDEGFNVNGQSYFYGTSHFNGTVTVGTLSSNSSLTVYGTLTATGAITASSYTATSDRRLKENIHKTDFDWRHCLDNLNIVDFTFKSDKEKKINIGLIAQELREVLPEKYRDAIVVEDESENHYLSINEDKLVYIALLGLKDQVKKISELEDRLNKIEKLINIGE